MSGRAKRGRDASGYTAPTGFHPGALALALVAPVLGLLALGVWA